MAHKYQFSVVMSCGGCSGAVDRSLKKLEGVEKYDISLETQTVKVETNDSLKYEDVLAQITKTGKKVTEGKEEVDGGLQERKV
ncbi:hypothetical protein L873DRAFT_1664177 [Choiromyces venosus 120613-1]|uniref:HMA domain-containing protein n=1 Tax=Choiromyces venosus 120613-1 TaxID=1336337 RepID=A0A3N4K770_9PEZI|nr:hypothetical protein L873DRAFT_1664177 [Choiromyces venosus 120613-1]